MRRCRTIGNMAQGIAQGCQIADQQIKRIGPRLKVCPREVRFALSVEHPRNVGKRETRRLPQCDQRQLQQRLGAELTS